MVHRTTRQHPPITKGLGLFMVILAILMIAIGIIIGIYIKSLLTNQPETQEASISNQPTTIEEEISSPEIDFQTSVDQWTASLPGSASVIIYDIQNNEIVSEHNPDDVYDTASLYKLFIVYEGYRRLENGTMQPDSIVGYNTILECLNLAIRESNSECAEKIQNEIGVNTLSRIITNDYEIDGIDISNLTANPRAILEIMKLFYYHPDIKNETYLAQIKDSFLNQPATTYDWRQGLPSGFSAAKVYNKVGWDYNPAGFWNVYHDTAIIEFPEQNRQYIIVVMTTNTPYEKIRELGSTIESLVLNTY